MAHEPAQILRVISELITVPQGSTVYDVPVQLSRSLSTREEKFLGEGWAAADSKDTLDTSAGGPGVVTLRRTTIEAVRDTLAAFLTAAVATMNAKEAAAQVADNDAATLREDRAEAAAQRTETIRGIASDIRF